MISSRHRFHGHNSLSFVYQKGHTVRTPQLSLKFVLNPRRKIYRVAVVVSRKVNKSAVVRNRIRRRVYELVRLHEALIPESYDLVFTAFGEQLATMAAAELETVVLELLRKLGPRANFSQQTKTTNPRGIVNPRD